MSTPTGPPKPKTRASGARAPQQEKSREKKNAATVPKKKTRRQPRRSKERQIVQYQAKTNPGNAHEASRKGAGPPSFWKIAQDEIVNELFIPAAAEVFASALGVPESAILQGLDLASIVYGLMTEDAGMASELRPSQAKMTKTTKAPAFTNVECFSSYITELAHAHGFKRKLSLTQTLEVDPSTMFSTPGGLALMTVLWDEYQAELTRQPDLTVHEALDFLRDFIREMSRVYRMPRTVDTLSKGIQNEAAKTTGTRPDGNSYAPDDYSREKYWEESARHYGDYGFYDDNPRLAVPTHDPKQKTSLKIKNGKWVELPKHTHTPEEISDPFHENRPREEHEVIAPMAVSQDVQHMHPRLHSHINTPYGPGLRITGRQVLADVRAAPNVTTTFNKTALLQETTGGASLFAASSDTTVSGDSFGAFIKISPDYLNARIQSIAQLFSRWRWISGHVMYTPKCAATQTGSFAFAHSDDVGAPWFTGVSTSDGPAFARVAEIEGSKINNFWAPNSLHIPRNPEYLYTEAHFSGSNQTVADRTSCNGVFVLGSSTTASAGASTPYGTLWVCYDIELIDPTPSYALSTLGILRSQVGLTSTEILLKYLIANPALCVQILRSIETNIVPKNAFDKRVLDALERLGVHSDVINADENLSRACLRLKG